MDCVTARGLADLYPAVKAVPRAKLHTSSQAKLTVVYHLWYICGMQSRY